MVAGRSVARRNWLVAAVVLMLVGSPMGVAWQDAENPYRKAKVGDWVEYTAEIGGQTMTMRQTVTAKTDKVAKVKSELKIGTNAMPGTEIEIPLDKPLDPTQFQSMGAQGGNVKPKVKELERKADTIKAAGKEFQATRYKMQSEVDFNGQTLTSTVTVWVSPEAPLSGMVKMQVETPMMPQPMVFILSQWKR
jgi:hypothetical protein